MKCSFSSFQKHLYEYSSHPFTYHILCYWLPLCIIGWKISFLPSVITFLLFYLGLYPFSTLMSQCIVVNLPCAAYMRRIHFLFILIILVSLGSMFHIFTQTVFLSSLSSKIEKSASACSLSGTHMLYECFRCFSWSNFYGFDFVMKSSAHATSCLWCVFPVNVRVLGTFLWYISYFHARTCHQFCHNNIFVFQFHISALFCSKSQNVKLVSLIVLNEYMSFLLFNL